MFTRFTHPLIQQIGRYVGGPIGRRLITRVVQGLLLLLPLIYLSLFSIKFFNYAALTRSAPAIIEAISVVKRGADRYGLEVCFSYEKEEQTVRVKRLLDHLTFRNPDSAQFAYPQVVAYKTAFYSSARPHKAQLVRLFPWKALIEAVMVVAISLYLLVVVRRLRLSQ